MSARVQPHPMTIRHAVRRALGRLRARRLPAHMAPIAPHEVAIIVLNWNRREDTLACLDGLSRARLDGARVLVVDNGSTDGSVEAIRATHPAVEVVALVRNEGYAGGNNAGMRAALAAGARAVVLLNNDALVAPEFLEPLLAVLNGNPRVAAVAAAVFRADVPQLLDVAWLDVYFGHGLVHRRGVNAMPGEGFDRVQPIEVGTGCCLAIRAEALERLGLFDEAFFAYHEEVDWCWRAYRQGWLVYYQPFARVEHLGSRSTGALVRQRPRRQAPRGGEVLPNAAPLSWNPVRTYLGARNAVRFVRKHGGPLRRLYYALSTLYAVPLETLAVILGREEELMLGLWTYRRALSLYARRRPDEPAELAGTHPATAGALVRLPLTLARDLPRDVRAVRVEGALDQVVEHVRGLRDGLRDRPLPLERLGLR